MLTIYLASLLTGAGLILLSQLLGHGQDGADHGGGHDVGHDAGHDAGGDGHHGDGHQGGGHGHHGWLAGSLMQAVPLASLSFWTYSLMAFGLVGLLLTWLGVAVLVGVLPVAAVVGYVAGVFAVQLLRRLRRSETDSSIRAGELVGSVATVLLPVGKGQAGKVRLQVKGRLVDLIAYADDDPPLSQGRTVVVHEVQDDGAVRVVTGDEGQEASTWKS